MDDESIKTDLRRALAGDEPALNRLVGMLTPVIQSRVARVLLSRCRGSGRDIRQDVEDLTQDVFFLLFADGGKVLRSWEPERGLSLSNFVGLVAERKTVSFLRSGKRSQSKEDLTLTEDLDQDATESGPDPEKITASRELLRRLLDRLKEELSPLGWHLFDLLFLQELPIEEVTRVTGMSRDAVYAWRSRLRRLACRLLRELSEDPDE
jgi:RNA polymerase sigma-70 factor (ECF subfamily)